MFTSSHIHEVFIFSIDTDVLTLFEV